MPRRKLAAGIVLVLALASAGCGNSSHQAGTAPAPTVSTRSSSAAPAGGPGPTTPTGSGCSDDTATAAVLGGLAAADGRATAAELPGYTFYANCGHSYYAVAALAAGPLATDPEITAFGSGAATAEFFTSTGGSNWTMAARSSGSFSCASFNVPAGLRAIWGNCDVPLHVEPPGPPAATEETACLDYSGARTYVRLTGLQADGHGSATLQGIPQGVHCGGPDDLQYATIGTLETLHLLPGAKVGIFDVTAGRQRAESIAQLAAYLPHPELGIFEVYGVTPNLVTGVAEQFHP